LSRFSAEPAFSVAVSFDNLGGVDLGFGLHQGTPIALNRCLMICSLD